ncbi:MAG: hypothetical protein IPK26_19890 [Planctomycetes bacterium]|nr:hypothetical protein [Planctomycetota bacterium]
MVRQAAATTRAKVAAGLVAALLLVVLAWSWPGRAPAVSTVPISTAGLPQGHVYTGVADEPHDLNPFLTTGAVARRYVLGFTHDTLLDSEPVEGKLRPALARAYTLHQDGRTVDFELRPDVVFADGEPVTPADVLFTWEVARTPDLVLGTIREGLGLIESATLLAAPTPTLRVVLQNRHFAAVQAVGESWVVTQKRYWLRRVAELAAQDRIEPVPAPGQPGFGALLTRLTGETGPGSGPYAMAADTDGNPGLRPGIDLRMVRNEVCWRRREHPGSWNLGAIRLLFRSPQAAFTALLAGEIDWYAYPDAVKLLEQRPELRDRYARHIYDARHLGLHVVVWNCRRPFLADPRVRRALGMLFDRAGIVDRLLEGCGKPAAAFGKLGAPEYPPIQPLPYDLTQARALLRDAGYDSQGGRPLSLQVLTSGSVGRQIADVLVDAGKKIGVAIEVRVVDWNALTKAVGQHDFDAVIRMQGFRNWVDPYDTFHSGGGLNDAGWRNADADRLLKQARVELDDARRAAVYRQFHELVAQEQPMALLAHVFAPVLIDARLQDATPGPLGLWPERFWMPVEHQRR